MRVTYVVNDLQINRYKVLKQLRQSKQRYESGRKSFEQEKMILQTLNHHAIPSLYCIISYGRKRASL